MPTNIDGFYWSLGGLVAIVIQPDLDQIDHSEERQGGYYGLYVLKQTFPPVVERIWYWYWQPYAKFFDHRSFFTHSPVGTAIRLIYAFWWTFPFVLLFVRLENFWWFVLSVFVCDAIHVIMDWKIWRKLGFFSQ